MLGCASMPVVPGTNKVSTNPIMELEIDLVFLDELAALTKLNQTILERMPVSLEDKWPELLNHYVKRPAPGEKERKRAYDECLTRLLKKDFSFFRVYNPAVYTAFLIRSGGFLSGITGGTRATVFVKAAEALGRRYEHAKLVLGHLPFGCKCAYYSRAFYSVNPSNPICQHERRSKCAFFYRPTEEMLYRYLFSSGFGSWVDLKIHHSCFRVVEGEHLGTFKEVFYTLLPEDKQDEIKRTDEELAIARTDLEKIKAQLKDKKLPWGERVVLSRQKAELEGNVRNKKILQKRLYNEALTTIEVTPEKIEKAKKLLEIAKFIDGNFNRIATAMTFLTVKIIDDIAVWSSLKAQDIGQALSSLIIMGVIVGPNAEALSQKRAKLLGKRVITLPINYAEILAHSISQKEQVAEYKGYLEALVKMEEKINL